MLLNAAMKQLKLTISRTRLVIACPWYLFRPFIFSILPAQFLFDDAFVTLIADGKPLLQTTPACFRAGREVWQLPVISFIVGWVRRQRVFITNAEILVLAFKHKLKKQKLIEFSFNHNLSTHIKWNVFFDRSWNFQLLQLTFAFIQANWSSNVVFTRH